MLLRTEGVALAPTLILSEFFLFVKRFGILLCDGTSLWNSFMWRYLFALVEMKIQGKFTS